MGDDYKQVLTYEQYLKWRKRVLKWLIDNDLGKKDLAEAIGYSNKTVYDALGRFDRCSKFFVAAVNEKIRHEKID